MVTVSVGMSSGRKSKSPGLKSPPATGSRTKLQHHTASWVIHNPYKLVSISSFHLHCYIASYNLFFFLLFFFPAVIISFCL